MKKKKINLFEAFAWIWSQHEALNQLWYDVNISGISEWYIDALISYWINHLWLIPKNINKNDILNKLSSYTFSKDSKNPVKTLKLLSENHLSILEQIIDLYWELDITKIQWNQLINKDIDMFTYSFPCQDISQQWVQKWFSKEIKSRSWLLWQIERILNEIKQKDTKSLPKILLMENVKALLSKNFENDLNLWIYELNRLWYETTKPFVINSANLWSAQSRERVFMVSILKEWNDIKLINEIMNNLKQENIDKEIKNNKKWVISEIFEKNMYHDDFKLKEWIIINHNVNKTEKWIKKWFLENYSSFNSENYFYYLDWQSPTITSSWAQSRIKLWNNDKLVYLNWFEHLKLQWFNDKSFYEKIKNNWITEQKIKFMAGNSINVDVLKYIFSKLDNIL